MTADPTDRLPIVRGSVRAVLRPAVGRRQRGAPFGTQVVVLSGRALRSAIADRKLLVLGLLQPVLLLVLFSQVFAGIGSLPGVAQYGSYTDFLVPATLVNIALTTAMGTGSGFVGDYINGMMARFRTLPMSLTAVLAARSAADTAGWPCSCCW